LPILVKLHPGSEKGLPDDDAIRGMLTRNHCFTYPGYEWAQTLFYVCRLGKEGVFTGEEAENLVKTGRPYHTTR
ncbi:hypothetical protein, partial [Candidatus Ichthyocystis hellenicum]|uniref:hypothetical protein n=1 Tax=Candidatus Ichthyocystis hellenicum TaxID=1561003 RepID=UPI0015856A27